MKNLTVLVIVISLLIVSEACRSSVKIEDTTLPAPKPNHIIIKDGGRVILAWDPVKASPDNPILGLKIKLWEQEKHKVHKYSKVNGTSQLTVEWVPVEKAINELPKHKPAFEAVLPADALETTFVVKKGEEYEIRGQSYNADGDGPLSSATGFMIHKD